MNRRSLLVAFAALAMVAIAGAGTRAALRAWQKARGLTADGYLSPDMVARLTAETAPKAAIPAPASTDH